MLLKPCPALTPLLIGFVADQLDRLKLSLMGFAALLVVAGVALILTPPRLNKEAGAFAHIPEQASVVTD